MVLRYPLFEHTIFKVLIRMRGGKTKTKRAKSSPRSVMGRLMPPVDIREENQLDELQKRIAEGPLTLVLVYADWCGHCQSFKPKMEELEKCQGRSVQTARIRDDMFPKSTLSNTKIEGYPTLMLVKKNGEAASFKSDSGSITNAIPDHGDMTKMKTIVRNAGTSQGLELLEKATVDAKELTNPTGSVNLDLSVDPNMPLSNLPNNIVSDRLSVKSVNRLNRNMMNSSNVLLKESTRAAKQTGGSQKESLYSQLMNQTIFSARSRSRKTRRAHRKTRRVTRK
jgi:thiol-disulfide isomerase/thioredoxin